METKTAQQLTEDQRARCFWNWASLHFNQRNKQFIELFEHCLFNAMTFGCGTFYRFNGGAGSGYNDDLVMTELEKGNHFQVFHSWRQASVYAKGLANLPHMEKVKDWLGCLSTFLDRVDNFDADEPANIRAQYESGIVAMFFLIFLTLATEEEQEEALQYA